MSVVKFASERLHGRLVYSDSSSYHLTTEKYSETPRIVEENFFIQERRESGQGGRGGGWKWRQSSGHKKIKTKQEQETEKWQTSKSSFLFTDIPTTTLQFYTKLCLYQVSPTTTSNSAVLKKMLEQEIDEQNRERKEEFL